MDFMFIKLSLQMLKQFLSIKSTIVTTIITFTTLLLLVIFYCYNFLQWCIACLSTRCALLNKQYFNSCILHPKLEPFLCPLHKHSSVDMVMHQVSRAVEQQAILWHGINPYQSVLKRKNKFNIRYNYFNCTLLIASLTLKTLSVTWSSNNHSVSLCVIILTAYYQTYPLTLKTLNSYTAFQY